MNAIRTSAAPTAQEGISQLFVIAANASDPAACVARSVSESSSVDCSCMRTVK